MQQIFDYNGVHKDIGLFSAICRDLTGKNPTQAFVEIDADECNFIVQALATAACISRQGGHDEQAEKFSNLRQEFENVQFSKKEIRRKR